MTDEQTRKYDILTNYVGIDSDALDLALSLCGIDDETFSNILYYYEAYTDFDEWMKDNGFEEED